MFIYIYSYKIENPVIFNLSMYIVKKTSNFKLDFVFFFLNEKPSKIIVILGFVFQHNDII